ncbi:MAG: hypothetical protein EPO40_01210 [Myxococcaceae bacterium]|nr:MAG: hypothetical protein EPO40_01210 [Myxococcaceae bacterium]
MDHVAPDRELTLRRALLSVVAASALTGVLAGLGRLGVLVGWGPTYAFEHGPLLVLGTFGTVIALERAVALARPWGFLAPLLGAVGAVATLAGTSWSPWAATASALALVALNAAIVRRQAVAFTWLMLLGSAVLALGDAGWALGWPVSRAAPTWIGFFVLTIVAERLELSRLAPTPRWATLALVVLASLLALFSFAGALGVEPSMRALGLTMALTAAWQLRYDLARRTLRRPGLPRFAATGVLLGAGWLLLTGALLAWRGWVPAGPLYDAALHGVFVGYVLSMVFAHAPIIFPAVARVSVPFSPLYYLPLSVLHLGLAARMAGDLSGSASLRQSGGVANAVALGLFVLSLVGARYVTRR